jgi:hypothetical protein
VSPFVPLGLWFISVTESTILKNFLHLVGPLFNRKMSRDSSISRRTDCDVGCFLTSIIHGFVPITETLEDLFVVINRTLKQEG